MKATSTRSSNSSLSGALRPVSARLALPAGVESLLQTIDRHDAYTAGHCRRVSHYAGVIAEVMGFSAAHVEFVRGAALLHDVGKIGVPETILQKRDELDDEEIRLIRLHPILGATVLSRIPDTEALVPIVLHHHERWDGRGYPSGLSGMDIPLESRLIFVADAFDAMTTDRAHRTARTIPEAMAEFERWSGQQFDPIMVDGITQAWREGHLSSVLP